MLSVGRRLARAESRSRCPHRRRRYGRLQLQYGQVAPDLLAAREQCFRPLLAIRTFRKVTLYRRSLRLGHFV
ncbi:MAG: hypothetical protein ACRDIB_10360, partial [Ardenticatenaceae bacterium]